MFDRLAGGIYSLMLTNGIDKSMNNLERKAIVRFTYNPVTVKWGEKKPDWKEVYLQLRNDITYHK